MSQTSNSAQRVLDILKLYQRRAEYTAEDIAKQIGIPKSTIYRYINLLCTNDFLEKSGSGYRLGAQMIALRGVTLAKNALIEIAYPYMEAIAAETGETVLLTKVVGHHSVCVERIEGQRAVRISFEVGQTQRLHAGASSKLLLAYLPAEQQDAVLSEPLPKYTENTVINPDALRGQLQDIVNNGFCMSDGEVDTGAAAVAVPVRNNRKRLLAALSIAGPTFRMTPDVIAHYTEFLMAQAAHIEERLNKAGYNV